MNTDYTSPKYRGRQRPRMIGAHAPRGHNGSGRNRQQHATEREIREGFEHFTRQRHRTHLVRDHVSFENP